MRRAFVLALAVYLLTPAGISAQEVRSGAVLCDEGECALSPERERELRVTADSLRAALDCPTDVDWPPLPAEGRTIVRSPEPERTDVKVPQYAYYYDSGMFGDAACLPVIIVQAQGSTLGWVAVLEPPPAAGGSFVHFFDLLGTEPPAGARSAGPVGARTPEVAPEVTYVVTGGYWTAGEMGGQYRMIVWNEGSERVHSTHRLQWIALPPDGATPTVLASMPIAEFGATPWLSRPRFESRGGAPVFILEQTGVGDPSRERVVEVHPGAPGEYRLKLTSERRDL